jgi:hypothetical protein
MVKSTSTPGITACHGIPGKCGMQSVLRTLASQVGCSPLRSEHITRTKSLSEQDYYEEVTRKEITQETGMEGAGAAQAPHEMCRFWRHEELGR